ncbi:MAG: hypothetical protein WBM32_15010 [Crocosphaera sp.]|jgi:selenocysteine-specific translation elongation factor
MTEREFETISNQLNRLENKIDSLDRDNQLLAEKLELYRQTGEAQIQSIRAEVEAFQEANKQQITAFQETNQKQIEAFQEANKQQLNVSLGVLVTAAITIVASVVVGMQ